ncbi:MAG TPA: hypothetical protein DCR93_11750, partial [Cytophagales bacterium]|nr:hypothetical protein [Cytophagales bacterium]
SGLARQALNEDSQPVTEANFPVMPFSSANDVDKIIYWTVERNEADLLAYQKNHAITVEDLEYLQDFEPEAEYLYGLKLLQFRKYNPTAFAEFERREAEYDILQYPELRRLADTDRPAYYTLKFDLLRAFFTDRDLEQSQSFAFVPEEVLNTDQSTATFLSPVGTLVTLPKNAYGLGFYLTFSEVAQSYNIPGTLRQFYWEGTLYRATWNSQDAFTGYFSDAGEAYTAAYTLPTDATARSSALLALPFEDQLGLVKFQATGLTQEKNRKTRARITEADLPLKPYSSEHPLISGQAYSVGQFYQLFPETEGYNPLNDNFPSYFFDRYTTDEHIISQLKVKLLSFAFPGYAQDFEFNEGTTTGSQEAPYVNLRNLRAADLSLYYPAKLSALRTYILEQSNAVQVAIEDFSLTTSAYNFYHGTRNLVQQDYQALTLEQRILFLKLAAQADADYEVGAVQQGLVIHTPPADRQQMLEKLFTERDIPGTNSLYETLYPASLNQWYEGHQLITLHLVSWIQEYYPKPEYLTPDYALENQLTILHNPGFWELNDYNVDITEEGNLFLEYKDYALVQDADHFQVTVPPYGWVWVVFLEDYLIEGVNPVKAGDKMYMPALYLYSMLDGEESARLRQ